MWVPRGMKDATVTARRGAARRQVILCGERLNTYGTHGQVYSARSGSFPCTYAAATFTLVYVCTCLTCMYIRAILTVTHVHAPARWTTPSPRGPFAHSCLYLTAREKSSGGDGGEGRAARRHVRPRGEDGDGLRARSASPRWS